MSLLLEYSTFQSLLISFLFNTTIFSFKYLMISVLLFIFRLKKELFACLILSKLAFLCSISQDIHIELCHLMAEKFKNFTLFHT